MPATPPDRILGIDLGTSSVKAVLLDLSGVQLAHAQVHYPVSRPREGWAEQDPSAWWGGVVEAVRSVTNDGATRIDAVGLSGQMHGLVLIDSSGDVLRPAIIWSDSRATEQVEHWKHVLDHVAVEAASGFPVATGMTGTSLSWVRENEPEVYAAAAAVLMPKDYIRFRLTGLLATDPTDAGGSLLYDIRAGLPARMVFDAVGLREELLPPVLPSLSVAGEVHSRAARETGIPTGTPVAAGGGDQSMAAIALGLDDTRRAAVAVSSGGTVFKRTLHPLDPRLGLHVMPHAEPEQWLAMGVVLSAGLSIDWLARRMFGGSSSPEHITRLMSAASSVSPGADGLLFASQLGGTRTPETDPGVRGSLVGLGYRHGQEHITRAMVEGVCISLARSLEVMDGAEGSVSELVVSGGGARFPLWRRALSDITALPVRVGRDVEHSAIGAALGAARAVGAHIDREMTDRAESTVYPDAANVAAYREIAARHRMLDDLEKTLRR